MALPPLTDKGVQLLDKALWNAETYARINVPYGTESREIMHFLIDTFANTDTRPAECYAADLEGFDEDLDNEGIYLNIEGIRDRNEEFEVDSEVRDSAGDPSGEDFESLREYEANRNAVLHFTEALSLACTDTLNNAPTSDNWDRAASAKAVFNL